MFHKFCIAIVLCAISLSFLTCSENRAELEESKKKLETSNKELKISRVEISKLNAKISEMEKEISRLSLTADGLWRQSEDCKDDECKVRLQTQFISNFPTDQRSKLAKKKIEDIQNKREEAERIARMASVTIREILADPKAYKGAIFERKILCRGVDLSEYSEPSDLAPFAYRTGKRYNFNCFWKWKSRTSYFDYDNDSMLEVRISQKQAKELAKFTPPEDRSSQKFIITALLKFNGQISHSKPVMQLKELKAIE